MSTSNQHRQPRGVPAGGQFAQGRREHAGLLLVDELAERDPVSIDAEVVEVLTRQQRALLRLASAWDGVHVAAGDTRVSRRPRSPWSRSDKDCRQAVTAQADAAEPGGLVQGPRAAPAGRRR